MSETAYITRLSAFLPNEAVDNEHMEAVLGLAGMAPSRTRRLVLRSNGIVRRHYVIDPATGEARYTNAQITANAVRALCGEEFELADIDCLAVGTSLADQLMPNHGVMVHGELGNPTCEVLATAGICLAGATALKYAWMGVASGQFHHAVATGSEIASLMLRSQRFAPELATNGAELAARPGLGFDKEFLRWMLSDGAGAALIQPSARRGALNLRIDWIDVFSYAHQMPACMYAGAERDAQGRLSGWLHQSHQTHGENSVFAVKQDVKLLNATVVDYCLERPLRTIIERRQLRADAIDWFLPHLSSLYFQRPVAEALERIGFPLAPERWFTNLQTRGNTGSASIYLMLEELFHSGKLRGGERLLCVIPESGRYSSAFMHLTVSEP